MKLINKFKLIKQAVKNPYIYEGQIIANKSGQTVRIIKERNNLTMCTDEDYNLAWKDFVENEDYECELFMTIKPNSK